jgi:hypothetical protein
MHVCVLRANVFAPVQIPTFQDSAFARKHYLLKLRTDIKKESLNRSNFYECFPMTA